MNVLLLYQALAIADQANKDLTMGLTLDEIKTLAAELVAWANQVSASYAATGHTDITNTVALQALAVAQQINANQTLGYTTVAELQAYVTELLVWSGRIVG